MSNSKCFSWLIKYSVSTLKNLSLKGFLYEKKPSFAKDSRCTVQKVPSDPVHIIIKKVNSNNENYFIGIVHKKPTELSFEGLY